MSSNRPRALRRAPCRYSKRTRFTERFDLPTKARLVGRALWRRVTG
jgi:hypothetical protein